MTRIKQLYERMVDNVLYSKIGATITTSLLLTLLFNSNNLNDFSNLVKTFLVCLVILIIMYTVISKLNKRWICNIDAYYSSKLSNSTYINSPQALMYTSRKCHQRILKHYLNPIRFTLDIL